MPHEITNSDKEKIKKLICSNNITAEIQNAKRAPRVFYARHMEPGIAKYLDESLLVDIEAMKRMMPTFEGRPVYVDHQKVNLDKIQHEADGFVIDCFYNELDGGAWSKILIVSDEGHNAVDKGYSVSNAYLPKNFSGKGKHLNVDYDRKIIDGEFTHLALVQRPRYETSKILSPEEFKSHQEEKRKQLSELRNSLDNKKETKFMLKFFRDKKEEITNAEDVLPTDYTIMEDGSKKTVKELLNAVEELEKYNAKKKEEEEEEKENEKEMKNSKYKLNGKEYSLDELKNSHAEYERIKKEACSAKKKKEKENEEDEMENEHDGGHDMHDQPKKKMGKVEMEKLKSEKLKEKHNSEEEIRNAEEIQNDLNFKKLLNADKKGTKVVVNTFGTALGMQRYG